MAVRAVSVGHWLKASSTSAVRGAVIYYTWGDQVLEATKLNLGEFDQWHRQAVMTARLNEKRELVFGVPGWKSVWMGAGEEKAVFLVIDSHNKAFALEVLAKASYLDGRLTEGHYFDDMVVPGLINKRWDSSSLFGHIFSGEVKAREFIYGNTLAGAGLKTQPAKPANFIKRAVGGFCRAWTRNAIALRYEKIRRTYKDAHEANVVVELLPLSNPENKKHYFLPTISLEDDGRLHLRYFRLTPIDVRLR